MPEININIEQHIHYIHKFYTTFYYKSYAK